jgi:uncharacterized protein (TIGR00661 family)
MRGEKTRVLVAPLDWGLGHATRCIPVIRAFLKNNCEVILAGDGHVENLLCREFPSLPFIKLKGYRIQYGNTKWKSLGKIIMQIPKILKAIEEENHWLQDLLEKEKIDIVISDNRYGLQHESVYSLFITHQLLIKTNLGKRADLLLQKLNYQYINAFNACWVPDMEGRMTLAGDLAHPEKLPEIPVTFIGTLSRFTKTEKIYVEKHLLILLSGPEPQRTIFENILMQQLTNYSSSVLFVRGLPASGDSISAPENVSVVNHLSAEKLQTTILEASYVISRCGYSTVMDLMTLHKKSILIPTPGQTEQEYLAGHLMKNEMALCVTQKNFNLQIALSKAASFPYKIFDIEMPSLLYNAIHDLLLRTKKAS